MEVVRCFLVFMIEGDDVGLDGGVWGLEVEADEVRTVRESVRIGDAMQMERRPALIMGGPQMSRDHPATRAAGAAEVEQLEQQQQQQPLR
jgi:hypothetical protein